MTEKELQVQVQQQTTLSVFSGEENFKNAMTIATQLSKSDIIPKEFQNKPANCLIAVELANRLNASPFQVMQNIDVIYGRPSLRSSFVIACINNSGKIKGSLKFEIDANHTKCRAWATEKETGEKLTGPTITMEMAQSEGWLGKNGSKWKTMPDLMLRYRAAAFFGRLYCPEILNGMYTEDEVKDFAENNNEKVIDVFAEPEEIKHIEEKQTETIKDDSDDIPQELIDKANAYYEEELKNEANG